MSGSLTAHPALATPPSPWWALFWKDWRQLRPALLAIIGGLLLTQIVMVVSNYMLMPSAAWATMTQAVFTIGLVSPALVALASAGMLIGHERQTRSWNWSSSLPVSWWSSLWSKLLVTITASTACLLALLLIPLFSETYLASVPPQSWVLKTYASGLSVLLAVDTIVFFLLAALLIRDALSALLAGAVWVLGLQFAVATLAARVSSLSGWFPGLAQNGLAIGCWVLLLLLGIMALVTVYRWRWGTGQFVELAWPRRSAAVATPAMAPARVSGQPSERRMLLQLALRGSLAKRFVLGVLIAIFLWANREQADAAFVLVTFLCGLLGVTAFESDQTDGRYRFLADRGANPNWLALSRLWIPLVLALAAAGCLWGMPGPQAAFPLALNAGMVGVLLVVVLVGALASLSFDKVIISAVVTVVTLMIGSAVYLSTMGFVQYLDTHPYWLGWNAQILFLCVSLPALVLTIFRWVPKWLCFARLKLGGRYFGLLAGLIFVPVLTAASTGYLFVPRVPWQGLTSGKYQHPPVAVPDLTQLPVFLGKYAPTGAFPATGYRDSYFMDVRQAVSTSGEKSQAFAEDGPRFLAALGTALENPVMATHARRAGDALNDALLATAALAVLSYENLDPELGEQSLAMHGALRATAVQSLAAETAETRMLTANWINRWVLSQSADKLPESEQLRAWLLPDLSGCKKQFAELAQARASFDLDGARGVSLADRPQGWLIDRSVTGQGASPYIPPLRWREERRIALNLHAALQLLNQPTSALPQMHPATVIDLQRNAAVATNYIHEYRWFHLPLLTLRSTMEAKITQLEQAGLAEAETEALPQAENGAESQ